MVTIIEKGSRFKLKDTNEVLVVDKVAQYTWDTSMQLIYFTNGKAMDFKDAEECLIPVIFTKYKEPEYITKVKQELIVLIERKRNLRLWLRHHERHNHVAKTRIHNEDIRDVTKLANAYYTILRQHNQMKKLYAARK